MTVVQLQTRVTPATRRAWISLAKSRRLSSGELLRQLVITVLDEKGAPSMPAATGEQVAQYVATLQARVDKEIKSEWSAKARRVGMTPSDMLRAAIASVLERYPEAVEEAGQIGPEIEGQSGGEVKISLTLNSQEAEASQRAAKALGWRRNTWVINVVRTAVFREPRPTEIELAALNRATAEVLAIGRNLNQIARALHRDDRYKDSVTVARLDQVREFVKQHAEATGALLAAIEARWRAPESFRPETE